MKRLLMIFVDGLGLGPADPNVNPVNDAICPHLTAALRDHASPIDAILGVPGLPQSATGQTSLLTGQNAQRTIGRHVEGFPSPALRTMIREYSIFKRLLQKGRTATFANGYLARTMHDVKQKRIQSVTTVATLSAFGDVRKRDLLEQHKAVSHDVTRESRVGHGYNDEVITPEQGAQDLIGIATEHQFTLFEFFQTDRAGHSGDWQQATQVLQKFDRFIAAILQLATNHGVLIILTSDHGNIEDLSVRTHTANPVPFLTHGPGATALRKHVQSLTDITPAIMHYLI